jgi:hypothetical protein
MQRAKDLPDAVRFRLADGSNVVDSSVTDTYTGECYCYN